VPLTFVMMPPVSLATGGYRTRCPVVLEAAKSGDEQTLSQLREAIQTLQVEYGETTGRQISRLSAVIASLADAGQALNASDPFFYYTMISVPTGRPAPSLTPGTVMSILADDDVMASRIDVVPDDPHALEHYGPSFTLRPTDDEAGARAAELLHKALTDGTAAQIGEGLDLTFDRLPLGLDDLVGQTLTGGTVEIGRPERVRRPMPDWDAELTMVTSKGRRSVRALLSQSEQPPEGFDDALVGRFGGMLIAAKFRRHETGGEIHWTFRHERNSSPVRDQVAALRFLALLTEGGRLIVSDRGLTRRRPPFELNVAKGVLSPQSQALVAFFEDILVIEEWTGETFELPDGVSGAELQRIAAVASLVRDGGRSISWSDATFRVGEAGAERLKAGGVLRVEQALSAVALDKTLELGIAQIDIPEYEIADVRAASGEPGAYDVDIVPPGGVASDVFERLSKVDRAAAPKEQRRKSTRKKKKHGRNR
jgi:hypothetical protein